MKKLAKENGTKSKRLTDESQMDVDGEQRPSSQKKKHRNLFDANQNVFMFDYGEEDYDEEDEVDDDELFQENVFNNQNAFGMNVFGQAQPTSIFNPFGGAVSMFGNQTMPGAFNNPNPQMQNQLQ